MVTKDLIQARKFSNMFRFIDDLTVINDGSEFEKVELKCEKSSEKQASFLDFDNVNKNFSLRFSDKRESFSFSIVRMPYLPNNMLSKIFNASLEPKFFRIARTTTKLERFKSLCAKITSRMMKQGDTKSRIKQYIRKIYGRHFELFRSFSPTYFDLNL